MPRCFQLAGQDNVATLRDEGKRGSAGAGRGLPRMKHANVHSEVSVGSTPTVLGSDCFEGLAELRPGNYEQMSLGSTLSSAPAGSL